MMEALTFAILLFGAIGAWLFPLVYGLNARWWGNPIGRMLMALGGVISLVYIKWIWLYLIGVPLDLHAASVWLNGVVAVAMWTMTGTIWHVILKGRKTP